jgi:hypothetical protein
MQDCVDDDPEPWDRVEDPEDAEDAQHHQEIQGRSIGSLVSFSGEFERMYMFQMKILSFYVETG